MLFSFHPIIARKSVFRIIKSLVKLYCHVFIILKNLKPHFSITRRERVVFDKMPNC